MYRSQQYGSIGLCIWDMWPYCYIEAQWQHIDIRAPSQYPKRRLSVRSRKVSKPRDRYFKLSYRFEIWQAHRQHCCRSACQISERSDKSKYKSRGFETLRDLKERRLFGYWDGAQWTRSPLINQCCLLVNWDLGNRLGSNSKTKYEICLTRKCHKKNTISDVNVLCPGVILLCFEKQIKFLYCMIFK